MKKFVCSAMACALAVSLVSCNGASPADGGTNTDAALEWYFPGDAQPDQDKVWAVFSGQVQEKIGAAVHINMIDRGSYNDKMKMILASGAVFDVCFTSNWTNDFMQAVSKGAYLALDDLLEKTPALKSHMPDFVWNGAVYNGKIYGVPSYQIMFTQNSVVVPKTLAEKYPVLPENPQSAADFEPFADAIRQNEPSLYPTQPLYNATEYERFASNALAVKKDTTDFKVEAYVETDEYKDFLRLRREWNQKGYYRPDLLTVNDDRNDRMALKYGLIASTYKPGSEAELKTLYGQDMLNIPYGGRYVTAVQSQGAIQAISNASKNAEKALQFLALLNADKEIYNLFIYGIENEHYRKIAENVIEKTADDKYAMASQWMFGNQFNAFYQTNQKVGVWEETDRMNREAETSPISGFVLDADAVKAEIAQYEAVVKEYAHLELGVQDPSEVYGEFLDKLKKAGMDKIKAEAQKQIDEKFKN